MKPTEPPLPELLTALVSSNNPLHVAYGHNYLFEERVAASRQSGYETSLDLPSADLKAWKNRHKDYLRRRIYVGPGEVAETFTSANADALLTALAEKQWIIRLENLDGILVNLSTDLDTVEQQLGIFAPKRRPRGDDPGKAVSRELL